MCDGRAGGLRAHHVLILLALELTLQLDLPGRGQVHGKEPCRVNKIMRQHGVVLVCDRSALKANFSKPVFETQLKPGPTGLCDTGGRF